jgi:putative phage-type endonuclease
MRILTEKQGTDDWDIARKGRITASSIGKVLAGKNTKTRREYMLQLVLDLEGIMDYADSAQWFEKGRIYEGHARGWYNWERETVTETGFVLHDEYNWLGASPDGLVGEDGSIEIKFREYLHTYHDSNIKPISRLYDCQMQTVMWVCNREWCDYVNYWRSDPHQKEQGHIRRVVRDEAKIRELEQACFIFWDDVLALYRKRTGKEHFTFPWDNRK